MLGMLFSVFSFISTHISLVLFSLDNAETDIVGGGILTDHWWLVVPEIFVPKIIKNGCLSFRWQSIMFGMFYPGHGVYMCVCVCESICCRTTYLYWTWRREVAAGGRGTATVAMPIQCLPTMQRPHHLSHHRRWLWRGEIMSPQRLSAVSSVTNTSKCFTPAYRPFLL